MGVAIAAPARSGNGPRVFELDGFGAAIAETGRIIGSDLGIICHGDESQRDSPHWQWSVKKDFTTMFRTFHELMQATRTS